MIQEIMHHLVMGWSGFSSMVLMSANRGERMSDENLRALKLCTDDMVKAIEIQERLRGKS